MDVTFTTLPASELARIAPLWEKLKRQHLANSKNFKEHYRAQTFKARCAKFPRAAGRLRIHRRGAYSGGHAHRILRLHLRRRRRRAGLDLCRGGLPRAGRRAAAGDGRCGMAQSKRDAQTSSSPSRTATSQPSISTTKWVFTCAGRCFNCHNRINTNILHNYIAVFNKKRYNSTNNDQFHPAAQAVFTRHTIE